MATPEQLEEEAAAKAMKPKPDPFEQDARREIRSYHAESPEEREARQEKNRQEAKDIREASTVFYPGTTSHRVSLRDKLIASSIGKNVRFDLQRGPAVKGKLVDVDLEMGNCTLQGPERSPPSLMFVQFRHIVRLEIYPD
ncbi:hypothetical protein AUG19_02240 [archaeon 13_1_20CM_2_54_9]|nr:MAG: hypothetical protein AUJ07_03955 [Crenarchaeota archaeon 13_1_40CM_3_53_5]OLE76666.1 MAG: hypothetical protein AUG19_02240 [archaeon 13_1_20CM_2_54_9]